MKTTVVAGVILGSLTCSLIAFESVIASFARRSAAHQKSSVTTYPCKRMADGKQWTTTNLNVNIAPSYCYQDEQMNCGQYGRLYTWDSEIGRASCRERV